jgi:hypothetical protein
VVAVVVVLIKRTTTTVEKTARCMARMVGEAVGCVVWWGALKVRTRRRPKGSLVVMETHRWKYE